MNKGALYTDLSTVLKNKKTVNFIVGLGGRDITLEDIEHIIKSTKTLEDGHTEWIGLNRYVNK